MESDHGDTERTGKQMESRGKNEEEGRERERQGDKGITAKAE